MKRLPMKETPSLPLIAFVFIMWIAALVAMFAPQKSHAAPNVLVIPMTPQSQQSAMIAPNPAYTDAIVLLATVSQTQAVPATSRYVVFSANCDFFAKVGASASVPGATTTDGTAAQLNPAAWWLYSAPTQITLVSASNCTVTLSFYS